MKRYLVFVGETYYPDGGMDDFKGDFDTLDEAKSHAKTEMEDYTLPWARIYDIEKRDTIWYN